MQLNLEAKGERRSWRGTVATLLCFVGLAATQATGLYTQSTSDATNAAKRTLWLSSMLVATPQYVVDFESYIVGTNLNGVALTGGAVVTTTSGSALVSSVDFGGASPIGTKALALGSEFQKTTTVTFAAPVDYFGAYRLDSTNGTFTVNYVGGGSEAYALGNTGNGVRLFAGIYRNDMPKILSVSYYYYDGGDGQWGLDNIEYGTNAPVPEPPMVLLAASSLALVFFKRR